MQSGFQLVLIFPVNSRNVGHVERASGSPLCGQNYILAHTSGKAHLIKDVGAPLADIGNHESRLFDAFLHPSHDPLQGDSFVGALRLEVKLPAHLLARGIDIMKFLLE